MLKWIVNFTRIWSRIIKLLNVNLEIQWIYWHLNSMDLLTTQVIYHLFQPSLLHLVFFSVKFITYHWWVWNTRHGEREKCVGSFALNSLGYFFSNGFEIGKFSSSTEIKSFATFFVYMYFGLWPVHFHFEDVVPVC